MKYLLTILLILSAAGFYLISISDDSYKRTYQFGEDGLIYNYDSDQLFTGQIIDTSDVIVEFEVNNGVKHGRFTAKYLDGQIEKTGFINQSNNEGEWRYYYPNGQLQSIGSFENDLAVGLWISYYSNGQVSTEGEYIDGEQHGLWTEYDKYGNIKQQIYYLFGNPMYKIQKT